MTAPHPFAALLHGLLKLLLLAVGHHSFQLLMRILHQRAHLLMTLLGGERSIVPHGFHLALLVLENRQDLLLLIRGQVQCFGQMLQSPLRAGRPVTAHSHIALHVRLGRRCRGIRRRGVLRHHRCWNAQRESQNRDSCTEKLEKFAILHTVNLSGVHATSAATERVENRFATTDARSAYCRHRLENGSCAAPGRNLFLRSLHPALTASASAVFLLL